MGVEHSSSAKIIRNNYTKRIQRGSFKDIEGEHSWKYQHLSFSNFLISAWKTLLNESKKEKD